MNNCYGCEFENKISIICDHPENIYGIDRDPSEINKKNDCKLKKIKTFSGELNLEPDWEL